MAEIIVGVDGSQPAAAALQWAAQESVWRGEPLIATLAWGFLDQHHAIGDAELDPEYDAAAPRCSRLVRSRPLSESARRAELRTIRDLPGCGLVEAAASASLLVVGVAASAASRACCWDP